MSESVVEHDFTAVNAAVDREQLRSIEGLRDVRARRWERWGGVAMRFAAATAIVGLALGLLLWLFGVDTRGGFKIYNLGPKAASEEQMAAIEQRLAGIRRDLAGLKSDQAQRLAEIAEAAKKSAGVASEDSGGRVTVTYTLFESVTVKGEGQIVTGRRYEPTDTDTPASEYCYHDAPSSRPGRMTTELAVQPRGKPAVWHPGVPHKLKTLGRDYCRFRRE